MVDQLRLRNRSVIRITADKRLVASARGVPPDSGVELDGTLVHGDPKVRTDWTNLVSEVVVRGGSLRYSTGLVGDGARRSWRVGGQRQLGRMRLDDPSIVAGWQDSNVSAPTPGVLWSSTRIGTVAETLGGYRLWPVQAAAEDPADSGLIPDTSQTGQRVPPAYVSGGGLGVYVSGLFVTDYGIDNLDGDRDADPGLYLSLWETGQTGAAADPAGRSSSPAGPSFVAGAQLGLLLFAPGRGIIRIPLGELIADLSLTEPYRVPWDSLGLTVADWAAFWAAGEQTAVLVDRANPNIDWATAEHVPDATVTEVEATQLQALLPERHRAEHRRRFFVVARPAIAARPAGRVGAGRDGLRHGARGAARAVGGAGHVGPPAARDRGPGARRHHHRGGR